MPGSSRALGILGWLVAAVVAITYLMVRYDVTIQQRGPGTRAAALAAVVNVVPGEVMPVVDERYADLAVEAQVADGAELLEADRRLEAAEREFPSDYRFTYERAALAVYGRAKHHEAFYHLQRAADKAIATVKAREMLGQLKQDGGAKGRLRRLAVGHREWSVLHEALEHEDRDRLWHDDASHRPVRTSVGMRASSLFESGQPCVAALIALREAPRDPEADEMYHDFRELCLRGPRHR